MFVLVVDDNDAHRLFITQALKKRFGAEVAESRNGVEALRELEKRIPDLIMLDLWMPVLNGHDLLERIRREDTLRHIPVVIMSALCDKELVQNLMAMKIADYMVKPISLDQLSERISRVLTPAAAPVPLTI